MMLYFTIYMYDCNAFKIGLSKKVITNSYFKEHLDYEIIQSTNPDFNNSVVRVNIFREHRQTIQVCTKLLYKEHSSVNNR